MLIRNRMFNILRILKEDTTDWVSHFREEDNISFELKTPYSQFDHRTWLEYETSPDGELIRMRLTHLFGTFGIREDQTPDQILETTNHLFNLLKENVPQFRGSSAYLGLQFKEGYYFVSLNAAPMFLAKWADADIAEVLNMQVFDLIMSLVVTLPEPIVPFSRRQN